MTFVSVQIDISNLETDDVIDEVERRGYTVLSSDQIDWTEEQLQGTVDEIHNLYQAFIHWKDFGMKDSAFEKDLKDFFEITLDKVVL